MTLPLSRELTLNISEVAYRPGVVETISSDLQTALEDRGWSVQSWTDPPSTTHKTHDHPYSHRVLCVDGSITFTVQGKSYELVPGDALDLPRKVNHSAQTGSSRPTTYWLLRS